MSSLSPVSPATASSEAPSSVIFSARRTESYDIPNIVSRINFITETLFGRINVIYLLEKANLAVTLTNQKNVTVAHAVFLDYPNWDIVDQAHWEEYLEENYAQNRCTPLNTLFMHLFMARNECAADCSKEIMKTVFKTVPELHYILLFIPSQENLGTDLSAAFEQVKHVQDSDTDYNLYVCHRHQFCPQLHIRIARVEDHDDLTPIFMCHNDTLRETYGEYFLAELIEAQDEDNLAVVCEDGGKAVGFMSVCSEVNIQLLHDCFDLGPFHGLCKPHPEDILKPPEETTVSVEESSSQTSQKAEVTDAKDSDKQEDNRSGSFLSKSSVTTAVASSATIGVPSKTGSILHKISEEKTLATSSSELPLGRDRSMDWKATEIPDRELFHPVYRGEVNAFCIQLFCIDEKHETRSLDFMKFVFNLFPDRDFCIISVPHMVPEFQLIQNFVRIVPFSNCTLDQELYVFHRSGLLKSFLVRAAKSSDVPAIEVLIKTLDLNRSILDDLSNYISARRDPDGTPVQAFVAEVLNQIVGISIIRNEMDIEYIRSHYNIEDFIYFSHYQKEEHGHLYHFALNPIFHHYAKHFMKEILRLADKSCLYYPIYPQSEEGKFQNPCAHSLTSALHYMVPVRPRRQIVYPLEKLGINAPSKQVSEDQAKYALNHFNRKLSLEPKVSVNARIVVVGASNVGISFLETLAFCHCMNDDEYALMSLCSWVNVVVGKMIGIDRSAKHVIVSKGRKIPYDHLILCTGQQYQVPSPSGADIKKLFTNRESLENCNKKYTGIVPSNLFVLCDDEDSLVAMKWLKEKVVFTSGNVIVYGNTIDIYTTIEALLSLGITGCRIHLVHPPLRSNITSLNNNAIEEAVQKALSRAGVTEYHDSLLAQWNDGDHPDPITHASFTTKTKPFRLQCSAFFNFTHKRVDYETFKAVNDACLVYDGRLVIDTNFHTNDVAIRAAGPLTKFSNIYYANEWTHSNFNSKEIGFQLAATMLNLFDPTLEPVFEPPEDMDRLIPIYKGCKSQGGVLPGRYNYVHIFKPGIPTRLAVQETQPNYGMAITTGDAQKGSYFRIHVNQYSMIETITCLSKKAIPVSNYLCLFGQHERLLNNLCSRWREGLITNLYRKRNRDRVGPSKEQMFISPDLDEGISRFLEPPRDLVLQGQLGQSYFKEPWALVIYHDRFTDLKKELRQILESAQEEELPSMQELVRQIMEGELALLERPKTYLKRCYKQSISRGLVEKSILDYLNYNNYHLPMFAWPGIV
ncbi:cilia- and flagella-associated protein 61 isoform X2 [Hemicordylus capensis]|uniref:cilia- and flagella-associated protein 61 isoform X2 n=1 Tax=Hemicordylus capensis TaxID=884348 RepID=UPI0023042AC4|nr:cilia- and flagella-associated protein 61 isoform X2 [Hemicordylus capensis]